MEQSVILAAVAEHVPLPDLSQDTKTGPAAFADPERATGVLRDAGFEDADAEAIERTQLWGADAEDAATFLFGWGPMRHWLRDTDPQATERARRAAVDAFRAYESDTGVRLTARLWLVTATWPEVA
ncbi:hypothetical protein ACRJ4B_29750 [Streptomyces sp. GTA36]